ncbi:protein FAM163A-like [Cyclopterus lumpus]|uniref:Uncharacterized protein n=1 Tax=Cyclopterus lumpus TaxID=8103 RepID=A0A8C3AQH7_CYCLU|nr:protein FAM163A-like [Cyclopterus lumpus]
MSAGTIVISGGILAGVILLCIVAVLCYCRLQYYCCKKSDSEVDVGSVVGADPLAHFPCNACNALAMDGAAVAPVSLDQLDSGPRLDRCPTCSPYSLRSGLTDDLRNGGERLGFHTYYENPCVALPLCAHPQGSAHNPQGSALNPQGSAHNPQGSSPLIYYGPTDMFPPPPRPYSTQV